MQINPAQSATKELILVEEIHDLIMFGDRRLRKSERLGNLIDVERALTQQEPQDAQPHRRGKPMQNAILLVGIDDEERSIRLQEALGLPGGGVALTGAPPCRALFG